MDFSVIDRRLSNWEEERKGSFKEGPYFMFGYPLKRTPSAHGKEFRLTYNGELSPEISEMLKIYSALTEFHSENSQGVEDVIRFSMSLIPMANSEVGMVAVAGGIGSNYYRDNKDASDVMYTVDTFGNTVLGCGIEAPIWTTANYNFNEIPQAIMSGQRINNEQVGELVKRLNG